MENGAILYARWSVYIVYTTGAALERWIRFNDKSFIYTINFPSSGHFFPTYPYYQAEFLAALMIPKLLRMISFSYTSFIALLSPPFSRVWNLLSAYC